MQTMMASMHSFIMSSGENKFLLYEKRSWSLLDTQSRFYFVHITIRITTYGLQFSPLSCKSIKEDIIYAKKRMESSCCTQCITAYHRLLINSRNNKYSRIIYGNNSRFYGCSYRNPNRYSYSCRNDSRCNGNTRSDHSCNCSTCRNGRNNDRSYGSTFHNNGSDDFFQRDCQRPGTCFFHNNGRNIRIHKRLNELFLREQFFSDST